MAPGRKDGGITTGFSIFGGVACAAAGVCAPAKKANKTNADKRKKCCLDAAKRNNPFIISKVPNPHACRGYSINSGFESCNELWLKNNCVRSMTSVMRTFENNDAPIDSLTSKYSLVPIRQKDHLL